MASCQNNDNGLVFDGREDKNFYDTEYCGNHYAIESADEHKVSKALKEFIDKYHLRDKRCLEIGCGRGIFQDLVNDYTGIDLSDSLKKYFHKPFYQSSASKLPFEDNDFDIIWAIWALEHIHDPEKALVEMRRVLKPGGLLFLHPAWFCQSWFADGYLVRPYRDFNLGGKIIKCSLLIRDSIWFQRLKNFLGRPKNNPPYY